MNRIYVTDIESIDQDGRINRAEVEVLDGDKPENMDIIRNLVTVVQMKDEQLSVEFFQEETGISLLKEITVNPLEEGIDQVDLLKLGQAPLRAIIKDITDVNTIIISSMFEDLTLKEEKEYFLQSIVFSPNEETYKAVVEALKDEGQESGAITFDIGQIVESLNVNQVVEGVKKHMRENNNPTHRSDLQLEHTLVTAIYNVVGSVKFADMVRIHKEKQTLLADFPDVEKLEDGSVVGNSVESVE
ncbi:hypothetical protein AGENTSMITH_78 [Bacillus phage vB_BspM_AgentSmith]|nr:hypothetical protein AGENTSMITH_78 [Bacillus phage vB_BspM_AgentSmith]